MVAPAANTTMTLTTTLLMKNLWVIIIKYFVRWQSFFAALQLRSPHTQSARNVMQKTKVSRNGIKTIYRPDNRDGGEPVVRWRWRRPSVCLLFFVDHEAFYEAKAKFIHKIFALLAISAAHSVSSWRLFSLLEFSSVPLVCACVCEWWICLDDFRSWCVPSMCWMDVDGSAEWATWQANGKIFIWVI